MTNSRIMSTLGQHLYYYLNYYLCFSNQWLQNSLITKQVSSFRTLCEKSLLPQALPNRVFTLFTFNKTLVALRSIDMTEFENQLLYLHVVFNLNTFTGHFIQLFLFNSILSYFSFSSVPIDKGVTTSKKHASLSVII